jgi:hypothetical protein
MWVVPALCGVATLLMGTSVADAMPASTTPVHASADQVAHLLFVAGDVGRLSQVPSGTEDVVLEKILQQLYVEQPTLDPAKAIADIQALQAALGSGSQALSASTLTVMAGNQRILAILRALSDSSPPSDVAHAVAQVTDQALNEASQSMQMSGQAFDASADSLSTITYMSFSPARVLAESAALAASNHAFGSARDGLWKQTSHESVFDDSQTLLAENPALENSAVRAFAQQLGSDGSLTTTVGSLETLVAGGIKDISDQNCTLAPGTTGGSPSDCASGALHDAALVAQQCPDGAGTSSSACQAARNQAQADGASEVARIAAQQAATTAEADALGEADAGLQQAEMAEAQAAAQLADDENQYLEYQAVGTLEKSGFDLATLAVTLSVSEIDPVYAATSVFAVVGDVIGFSTGGPDPNTIIVEGLQNISQQLSDFEQYTQTAFHVLDTQLGDISAQIAQDAYQFSAQLTQVQLQVTQLQAKLTTLQGSVDHLESEVQSLFAQGARNDLSTLVNQYLGYRQANGVPLPQTQFAQAAGALYQDATSTALTQTILNPPAKFDALDANSIVTSGDPFTLDSNINLFNLFGAQVTDAPPDVTWPGALTTACPANADPAHGLCLPDPDFWATSARAFAQLLTENPQYVTPTRLAQLDAIAQEGKVIANALHQLSVNDAGSDPNGTGNRTLDAAINYYGYWGGNRIPYTSGAVPELGQALHNEEQHYLDTTAVPGLFSVTGQPLTYHPIQLYGGASQTPDLKGLLTTNMFQKIPLCQSEATGLNPNDFELPSLTPGETSFLRAEVLNGARLGAGTISACWAADFIGPTTADGGQAVMSLLFNYNLPDDTEQVGDIEWSGYLSYCATTPTGSGELDAINAALACPNNVTDDFEHAPYKFASDPDFAKVLPEVNGKLAELQAGYYKDILSDGGSTLTSGTSVDTDVQAAATRLAGANAILNGYISLGLPQSLASDDTLRSLVSGANADAFARTTDNLNPWGAAYASDVPGQLVNFYKAALSAMPNFDPADFAADLVYLRSLALEQAIRPHIVPSSGATRPQTIRWAPGIAAASTSGTLAEINQIIGPTLDRLSETRVGLADTLANGATLYVSLAGTGTGTISDTNISCQTACSHNYAPGTSVTLTATPANGATFTGWSGACSGTGPCTLVLNYDQVVTATFVGGAVAPTTQTSTPPTTGPQPTPATGPQPAPITSPQPRTAAPRCTLTPKGTIVLLAKRRAHRGGGKLRALTLTVRCDQAASVKLTGRLRWPVGPTHPHHKQRTASASAGPVRSSVSAGAPRSLTITIPATALQALSHNARVSATFTLSVANSNGTSSAATTIRKLTGAR